MSGHLAVVHPIGRMRWECMVSAGVLSLILLLTACTSEKPSSQASVSSRVDSTAVSDTLVQTTPAEAKADSVTPDVTLALTYAERRGRRFFLHYCAVCHGEVGAGDGFNAYNLTSKPRDFTDPGFMKAVSDGQLTEVITQGGRGVNKSPAMPAWEYTLSSDEIRDVVAFIRTLIQARHHTAQRPSGQP